MLVVNAIKPELNIKKNKNKGVIMKFTHKNISEIQIERPPFDLNHQKFVEYLENKYLGRSLDPNVTEKFRQELQGYNQHQELIGNKGEPLQISLNSNSGGMTIITAQTAKQWQHDFGVIDE